MMRNCEQMLDTILEAFEALHEYIERRYWESGVGSTENEIYNDLRGALEVAISVLRRAADEQEEVA